METELSVVERVNELANASGKALEFEVQELNKLAERAKTITSFEDKSFKEVKSEMVKKRTYIKQYCLDARRDIKKVAEGVSDVEKMLYAIFVPEEDRLAELAEEAKQKEIRAEREQKLPWRKEQLLAVEATLTDEELLALDDKAFQILLNEKTAEKQARRIAELEAKEAQERREKELAEAAERAKQEAEENAKKVAEEAERRHKEELERVEREAKEREEKIKREAEEKEAREAKAKKDAEDARIEAERIAKQEAEKLAKKEDYIKWLADNGYSAELKEQFFVKDSETEIKLYKLVGTYLKK